jgi:hypothetical protein
MRRPSLAARRVHCHVRASCLLPHCSLWIGRPVDEVTVSSSSDMGLSVSHGSFPLLGHVSMEMALSRCCSVISRLQQQIQHNTFDLPSRKSLLRSVLSDIATFDRPLHAACLICYVTSPRQKKPGPIDAIQPQASAAVLTEPNEAGLLFISLISRCGFKLRSRMQSFRSVHFLVMPCESVVKSMVLFGNNACS